MMPWNKGTKGVMKVNSGSFKKGLIPWCKKESIKKVCLKCKKIFFVKPSLIRVRYCSYHCARSMHSNFTGKKHSEESRKKMSESHIGLIAGEKHYLWIKDRTKAMERHRLRGTIEWKIWRGEIFERDNYTCRECGISGVYLEPHHIIPIRSDKENIFNIKNGITLCRQCHIKTLWKESNFAEQYTALVAAQ
jgi:5-methylcytosine-specific restriction endonuclease McrA